MLFASCAFPSVAYAANNVIPFDEIAGSQNLYFNDGHYLIQYFPHASGTLNGVEYSVSSYYYIITWDSDSKIKLSSNGLKLETNNVGAGRWYCYKANGANPYSAWTVEVSNSGGYQVPLSTGEQVYDPELMTVLASNKYAFNNGKAILYTSQNIYQNDGTTVFFGQTPSSSALKTHITGLTLGAVLQELVSLLPILLPVSITFISIRKGIAFCFRTLRAA
ncbi:MAG: hypothetical protein ACI4IK_00135 [Eubacterium sp.]